MRLRNIKGAREAIVSSPYTIKDPAALRGKWSGIYTKNRPLHIEIGMGKGKFLMEMARNHPEIYYIGIEKYSSVLIRALEKMEEDPVDNLRFIRMEAEEIGDIFAKNEVEQIYLNFSDPWPKERHAKRRLTSRQFLDRYRQILSEQGRILFKTDNRALFEFSLEEIREAGWILEYATFDLHHSPWAEGNIMTEYEEKFVKEGKEICKLSCRCPASSKEESLC